MIIFWFEFSELVFCETYKSTITWSFAVRCKNWWSTFSLFFAKNQLFKNIQWFSISHVTFKIVPFIWAVRKKIKTFGLRWKWSEFRWCCWCDAADVMLLMWCCCDAADVTLLMRCCWCDAADLRGEFSWEEKCKYE